MSRRIKRNLNSTPRDGLRLCSLLTVLFFAFSCLLLSGCVHRQFTITTNPPGSVVQVNGKTVGATPVDVPYTYYGKYRLTILRDGFQTLVVDQPVPTPWYEYLPFEFISEHLVPWTIRDHRQFHYDLLPLPAVSPEGVLNRSEILRSKGKTIGAPLTPEGSVTVPAGRIPNQPFEVLPVPSETPKGQTQPENPSRPQTPTDGNQKTSNDMLVVPVPVFPPKQ